MSSAEATTSRPPTPLSGLHVAPNWAEWLRAAGLASWDALWQWSDGAVMRQFGTRRTVRLERAGQVLYLKRHSRVAESDGWWAELGRRLRGQPARTDARREWDNLHALSAAGLTVPEAVALGECPHRSGASLLLTAAVPDAEPADDLLSRTELPLGERRTLLTRIARLARRLHDAGFWHQDLYLCHVFVGPPPSRPLTLIDLQRVGCSATGAPWDRRVKDLAQLVYSLRPDWASRTDRLRVLSAYAQASGQAIGVKSEEVRVAVDQASRERQRPEVRGTRDQSQCVDAADPLFGGASVEAHADVAASSNLGDDHRFDPLAAQQNRLTAAVWAKAAQIARRDRKRLRAAAAAGHRRAAEELHVRELAAHTHAHAPGRHS